MPKPVDGRKKLESAQAYLWKEHKIRELELIIKYGEVKYRDARWGTTLDGSILLTAVLELYDVSKGEHGE